MPQHYEEEKIDQLYTDITRAGEDKNIKPTILMRNFHAKIGKIQKIKYEIMTLKLEILQVNGDLEHQDLHGMNTNFNKKSNRKIYMNTNNETKN